LIGYGVAGAAISAALTPGGGKALVAGGSALVAGEGASLAAGEGLGERVGFGPTSLLSVLPVFSSSTTCSGVI
jgi:hypothetical protein